MRSPFHFKSTDLLKRKEPDDLQLKYTSVQRFELHNTQSIDTAGEEMCVVVLQGDIQYELDDTQHKAHYKDMLYLPRKKTIHLSPDEGAAVVMAYGAPAHRDTHFSHISFADIDADPKVHKQYGKAENHTQRDVWHYINDDDNACRLMMGICQGRIGGWTSWPPHEHSEQREEVYTYFDMGKAFAVQCVYEDMDDPIAIALVRDGDLVSIPRGYHPNVGSPAGRISFVYCMVATRPDERKFMDLHIQDIYGESFE